MNETEKRVIRKVLKEMKNAHAIMELWLKGTPIEATLADWIQHLESLLV